MKLSDSFAQAADGSDVVLADELGAGDIVGNLDARGIEAIDKVADLTCRWNRGLRVQFEKEFLVELLGGLQQTGDAFGQPV